MPQMLLFPDPRPLVERLGREFFLQLPEGPGVYLMRAADDTVLYVGKAKNLRKRLGSYRVANPERLPRRHLRLLRAVARIELRECPDEPAALAREAELLRELRPRFNRSGTWAGPPRFLSWRLGPDGLELAVKPAAEPEWQCHGPLGAGAWPVRAALARLLWCGLYPDRGLTHLPAGWFRSWRRERLTIPRLDPAADFAASIAHLTSLLAGRSESFVEWIQLRTATQTHPFEEAVRAADLETVVEFAERQLLSPRLCS